MDLESTDLGSCRSIIDGLGSAVFVCDPDGRIIYMNSRAEGIAGRGLDEARGLLFADVMEVEDLAALDSPGGFHREIEAGGRLYSLSASELEDGGRAGGTIITLEEIPGGRAGCSDFKAVDEEEIRRRDRLLAGIALAANHLMVGDDHEEAIYQALEILGCSADVDRAYILEIQEREEMARGHEEGSVSSVHSQEVHSPDSLPPVQGRDEMVLRYEWSREGVRPRADHPSGRSFGPAFACWLPSLSAGMPIRGTRSSLPAEARDLLESMGARSIFIAPVTIKDRLWGAVAFEDCRTEREWTWCEASILLVISGTIGGALSSWRTEERLKKSEECYRELIQNANSIILRLNTSGEITFINEFAQEFFGYREDEILGRKALGTIVPEVKSTDYNLSRMIAEIVQSPERYMSCVDENVRKSGERVWIAWTNRPILDDAGRITGVLAIGNDMTARKQAEEELKATHERLMGIIEFLPDATFVVDREKRVIAWNRAMEEMTGVKKSEILGHGDHAYSVPFYGHARPMLIDLVDNSHGITEPLYPHTERKGETLYTEVFVPSLSKGRGAYLWATASPLYDSLGNLIGSIESVRDITDWKTAAEELKARDRLLEGVALAIDTVLTAPVCEAGISKALEILGRSADLDRVYIFENGNSEAGKHLASLRFEWTREGVEPQIGDPHLQSASYDELFPRWHSEMKAGEIVSGLVREFPEPERAILEPQKIVSLLAAPIIIEDRFWGFIGFDDCHSERQWTRSEASILAAAAGSIGATIIRRQAEVALKESEERFRTIFETAQDCIFLKDRDHRYIKINPAMEKLFELPASEMLGKTYAELYGPEFGSYMEVVDGKVLRGEIVEEEHPRIVRGKDSTIHTIKVPVRDKDGEIIGLCGIARDISERKRADERLRLLELAVDNTNEAVLIAEPDTENPGSIKIIYVNEAFTRITGYSPGEVLEKHPRLFEGPGTDEARVEGLISALSMQKPIKTELGVYRKDGSELWLDLNMVPVFNEGREVTHWVSLGRDATERKRSEDVLTETRDYLESLLDYTNAPIIVWDPSFRITRFNRAFERLTGLRSEDVLGSPLQILFPETTREDSMAHIKRTLSGERWETVEIPILRSDGSIRTVLWNSANIHGKDGAVIATIAQGQDITERKGAEEQLRTAKEAAEAATRAKSEFLANMSHEIRTPMNAVIGMTGLIMDTDLTPEQRDYAETIRRSGDSLLALINDILDFSKIEGGKLDMESLPFCLAECIEESLDLVAAAASRKGLKISWYFCDGVPCRVVGDVTRVRQVLVNLLSNAVKFTEKGEVSLSVYSQGLEGGQNEIRFSVKDTGIGIPAERMDRLFHTFSQLDSSMTRRYGGTGLGLAISRRLVELMGGRIWVESDVGRGSTFHFTILAAPCPGSEAPGLSGRRALVVSEDRAMREGLMGSLASWSMTAEGVASCRDPLVERGGFDVIILDLATADWEAGSPCRGLPVIALGEPGRVFEGVFERVLSRDAGPSTLHEALMRALRRTLMRSPSQTSIDSHFAEKNPLRILLAEDNLVNQKVATRILERMGYRADVAADGIEVLRALDMQPYDVVLMDIQMPEMDGLQATRMIRERHGIEGPYIIAMTAHALKGDREECLDAGMNDYVSKPVKVEELQAALERSLHREPPAPLASPALPALDPAALEALSALQIEGDPDVVEEIGGLFLSRGPSRFMALKSALEAGDAVAVYKEAHSLKSSSANVAALGLSGIFREIEELGRAGKIEMVGDLVRRAEHEYERVKAALEAEISGRLQSSSKSPQANSEKYD